MPTAQPTPSPTSSPTTTTATAYPTSSSPTTTGAVATYVVESTCTFPLLDFTSLSADSAAYSNFSTSFMAQIAAAADVNPSAVSIDSIAAGSTVVVSQVRSREHDERACNLTKGYLAPRSCSLSSTTDPSNLLFDLGYFAMAQMHTKIATMCEAVGANHNTVSDKDMNNNRCLNHHGL